MGGGSLMMGRGGERGAAGVVEFEFITVARNAVTPPLRSPTIQSIYYAPPLIPGPLPYFPPVSLPMMHHASQPLPFPLFDQWAPSWPAVPVFAKPPDPSWFAFPSNPHPPPRRRPYHRLEQTAASPSSSRAMHPHSSRTRAHPMRTQAPPALSALPALPISLPVPALERESCLYRFGFCASIYSAFSASAVSPSDPGSPMSTAAPLTPAPEFLHVVCNAPLLAPKPLPYRPPAFLDSFELPDPDEDLSHPPYTRSSSKRKRTRDGHDDLVGSSSTSKRRATESVFRGLNGLRSQRRFSK
jgi:hypothetical protein